MIVLVAFIYLAGNNANDGLRRKIQSSVSTFTLDKSSRASACSKKISRRKKEDGQTWVTEETRAVHVVHSNIAIQAIIP